MSAISIHFPWLLLPLWDTYSAPGIRLGTRQTWSHLILIKCSRDFYRRKHWDHPLLLSTCIALDLPCNMFPTVMCMSRSAHLGKETPLLFGCLTVPSPELCTCVVGAHSFVECVLHVACPHIPSVPVALWKVWADAPMEAASPSAHLIIPACLSDSRSHVKLTAATDALFKVSSKMVLKCVTQLFPWCGQGIYGEVVFPLDGGGVWNQKPLSDTCVDVKRKTTG